MILVRDVWILKLDIWTRDDFIEWNQKWCQDIDAENEVTMSNIWELVFWSNEGAECGVVSVERNNCSEYEILFGQKLFRGILIW